MGMPLNGSTPGKTEGLNPAFTMPGIEEKVDSSFDFGDSFNEILHTEEIESAKGSATLEGTTVTIGSSTSTAEKTDNVAKNSPTFPNDQLNKSDVIKLTSPKVIGSDEIDINQVQNQFLSKNETKNCAFVKFNSDKTCILTKTPPSPYENAAIFNPKTGQFFVSETVMNKFGPSFFKSLQLTLDHNADDSLKDVFKNIDPTKISIYVLDAKSWENIYSNLTALLTKEDDIKSESSKKDEEVTTKPNVKSFSFSNQTLEKESSLEEKKRVNERHFIQKEEIVQTIASDLIQKDVLTALRDAEKTKKAKEKDRIEIGKQEERAAVGEAKIDAQRQDKENIDNSLKGQKDK